ncbi:MAG: ATP synthase F1 subunit delta [Dethiobacteria bacterium]|nr:ATP synthase F1 subunit delta [Bacillota bacterium]NMD32709.1 ATP synthase F1 subunit delta [Bacillota bacterium]HOB29069.1 ATP synthase F1 subunit delta [Bacillota bacterium]HPZ41642.1 ATP synthase F1 subunit delta [Bacillota bacterium]HQD52305.1 ATP synthase F1 subunit delta [Bacillota bacterium]
MSQDKVARVYAEALFSEARKMGQAEELGEKLLSLKRRMEEDAELQKVLQHELISPQEKEKALKELLPRLLSREREEMIISIVPEYQRLLDEEKDVEPVEVTLASAITPALESELKQRLAQVIGKKVRLEIKIDPKILGGMVLRWEDRVVDASVKKKLELIGDHLKTV